ncbi:MAG: FecR domain-containing protein [Bacteroides sp.]|nr:FecR domain-containing protein [Bacteroides sp.]
MDEKVLDKYIRGEATQEERNQVVEWMDADEEHVREVMALRKLHDVLLMNQVEEVIDRAEKPMRHYVSWRKLFWEVSKVAALLLLVLGIQFLMKKEDMGSQNLYVPAGQRAELTLPDGSKVWLNSRTRLTYPLTFAKTREVELDGEAYFTVARNEGRNFVVKTQGMEVRVLGTEFNVKAYAGADEMQVDLLKGSVELGGNALGGTSCRMLPKERIRIAGGKLEKSRIDDYDYFKWTEGLICFHEEPVSSIIKKLELYYNIHIVVNKKDFLNELYSGKFRTEDGVEQVLRILQLEHDFTYERDSDLNVIIIK